MNTGKKQDVKKKQKAENKNMIHVYVFEKGSVTPIPNSDTWAKDELFKLIYVANDNQAHRLFSEIRPDVILTVGSTCDVFPILLSMPLFIRSRWLHTGTKNEIEPWKIRNCFKEALKQKLGPRISVFMTAFESEDRITRAYHSLKAQTCTEWELVIIDDSKTNKTWDTQIRRLRHLDCRVRAFRGHLNDGFIGSVKRDVAMMCRGEFLVEMDHDDEILPSTLEDLIHAFETDPTVGMVGSDCIELFEKDLANWDYGPFYGFGFHAYYKEWYDNHWVHVARNGPLNQYTLRHIIGVLNHVRAWRATTYRELGGHDWNLNVVDDYELILKTFVSKYKIARLPKFLYKQYRTRNQSNFTIIRNAYIQKLVPLVKDQYDDRIHAKLLELGMEDNMYQKDISGPSQNAYYSWKHDPTADLVLDPNPDRVSIIIPTFKRGNDLLKRAVQSIFAQTFQNWIIYIIGDKCPVLDEVMKKKKWAHSERIRWWNLSENSGAGGARPRNYALKQLVTSNYVAYLDDDNKWEPNHLQSLYGALTAKPSTMFAFSSFFVEQENIRVLCSEPRLYRIDTSCLLHKTSLLHTYGYWRPHAEVGYAHDWELVARWVKNNEEWVATKQFTLNYNNANQDMRGILAAYDDQKDVCSIEQQDIKEAKTNEEEDLFDKVIEEEPESITRYHLKRIDDLD